MSALAVPSGSRLYRETLRVLPGVRGGHTNREQQSPSKVVFQFLETKPPRGPV